MIDKVFQAIMTCVLAVMVPFFLFGALISFVRLW